MTWLPLALTIASTVVSTVGAIQQGNAQADADRYNASVNRQNAAIAQQQGDAALAQQKQDSYRKLGAIKAGYGAAGVTGDGSPMDVLADSFTQSELDANTITYNARVRAAGYQNSANLDESSASNARTAGYTRAASNALLGGSRVYSAGYDAGYWG
jgi:hypothetical protein